MSEPKPPVAEKLLEVKLKNILEEYFKDCCMVAECDNDIRECVPASAFPDLLSVRYDQILEESKRARIRTATLFSQFIRMNLFPLDTYCTELKQVLEQADKLTVKNPRIWEYLAEIIAPLLYEDTLSLEELHMSCTFLISRGNIAKLLVPLFKVLVHQKGSKYLTTLWHSSDLIFEDFMPTDDINKFIKDNQLEFLVDGVSSASIQSTLSFEEIHEKLLQFYENENFFEDISNWITVNVGDCVKEKQFIRVLAKTVFENSIVQLELNGEILRKHYKLLTKYIDGKLENEIEILYALQEHITKLKNPQGLLLNVFMVLYNDSILSSDSIIQWSKVDFAEQTAPVEVVDKASGCDIVQKKNNKPSKQHLKYKDDQWSPHNTSGKKVYDKDFLLALRNDPKSKKKPDNLLEKVERVDRGQIEDLNKNVPNSKKVVGNIPVKPKCVPPQKTNTKQQKTTDRNDNYKPNLENPALDPDSNKDSNKNKKGKTNTAHAVASEDAEDDKKKNPELPQTVLFSKKDSNGDKISKPNSVHAAATVEENNKFMQSQVRGGAAQSFYNPRGPPPQSQTPRMGNHRQIAGQQPVFKTQSAAPYMQVQPVQPMYCMQYYGSTPRPTVQQFYQGQYTAAMPYPQAPPQAQQYHYFVPKPQAPVGSAPQTLAQRQPPPTIATTINQNPDTELLHQKFFTIFEEYLKDRSKLEKCNEDVRKLRIPNSAFSRIVCKGYSKVLRRSKTDRLCTATLFAYLITTKTLPLESYCSGLETFVEESSTNIVYRFNPIIIWPNLAEFVAPLLYQNILPLKSLHACCKPLIAQGNAATFLGPLLKLLVYETGATYVSKLWQNSKLTFDEFMPADQVDSFIKDNQLKFLADSALSYGQIHEKLLHFFKNGNTYDFISNWITVNVGHRVEDKQFIRVLATAVLEHSIVALKLNKENLCNNYKILLKYIDDSLKFEVQVLYAIQQHINKLEYPTGLLLNVFTILYEDSVLSHESFLRWKNGKNPAEQNGKRKALKQLTSFFATLTTDDEATSSSSEDY